MGNDALKPLKDVMMALAQVIARWVCSLSAILAGYLGAPPLRETPQLNSISPYT